MSAELFAAVCASAKCVWSTKGQSCQSKGQRCYETAGRNTTLPEALGTGEAGHLRGAARSQVSSVVTSLHIGSVVHAHQPPSELSYLVTLCYACRLCLDTVGSHSAPGTAAQTQSAGWLMVKRALRVKAERRAQVPPVV